MNNSLSYKGYTTSMVFDAEDKIIVGRVLDIDDIISFHGESVTEFEANFHLVVDGYVAACAELGGICPSTVVVLRENDRFAPLNEAATEHQLIIESISLRAACSVAEPIPGEVDCIRAEVG